MGDARGEKKGQCVVLSLSILIAATLAFLVIVAFFQDGGAGLYQWWRCQDAAGRLGEFWTDEAGAGGGGAPTTLSHIVFGIGASAQGWNERRGYVELWWRPGLTRGHVWLDQEPATQWTAATSPPYRVSADASRYGPALQPRGWPGSWRIRCWC